LSQGQNFYRLSCAMLATTSNQTAPNVQRGHVLTMHTARS
jgi:hypothetical protein